MWVFRIKTRALISVEAACLSKKSCEQAISCVCVWFKLVLFELTWKRQMSRRRPAGLDEDHHNRNDRMVTQISRFAALWRWTRLKNIPIWIWTLSDVERGVQAAARTQERHRTRTARERPATHARAALHAAEHGPDGRRTTRQEPPPHRTVPLLPQVRQPWVSTEKVELGRNFACSFVCDLGLSF